MSDPELEQQIANLVTTILEDLQMAETAIIQAQHRHEIVGRDFRKLLELLEKGKHE